MRYKAQEKICEKCENCIALGEGDFYCGYKRTGMVIEDYTPTKLYLKCKGKGFRNETNE